MKIVKTVASALLCALMLTWVLEVLRPAPETLSADIAVWVDDRIREDPAYTKIMMPVDPLPKWLLIVNGVLTEPVRFVGLSKTRPVLGSGLYSVVTVFHLAEGVPTPGPGVPAAVSCWMSENDELRIFVAASDPVVEIFGEAYDVLSPLCDDILSGHLKNEAKAFVAGDEI